LLSSESKVFKLGFNVLTCGFLTYCKICSLGIIVHSLEILILLDDIYFDPCLDGTILGACSHHNASTFGKW
jgi:hypothetical protein